MKKKKSSRGLNLCYLAANIEVRVGHELWNGINAAAEKNGVNLICIPGGRLRDTRDFQRQGNILYELISHSKIDGVLSWVSNLSNYVPQQEIIQFHKSLFSEFPLVALGKGLPGRSSVIVDSFQGMYDLISHMIEHHGFRKIGFIRAIEDHPYAHQRYQGYLAALKAHQLEIDPRLITDYGDWTIEAGESAMNVFLEQRGLELKKDLECVICSSDVQAFGVYNYCQRNNIWIPGELALAGFNDVEEGQWKGSPLSSVSASFYDQGYQGLELLLEEIETGLCLNQEVQIPSYPVIRQSCGCFSKILAEINMDQLSGSTECFSFPDKKALLAAFLAFFGKSASNDLEQFFKEFIDQLERDLKDEGRDGSTSYLRKILSFYYHSSLEFPPFLQVLNHLVSEFKDAPDSLKFKVHGYITRFRILIGEYSERRLQQKQQQVIDEKNILNEMGLEIITSYDFVELRDSLSRNLEKLQIPGCSIFLYSDSKEPLNKSRLVYQFVDEHYESSFSESEEFPSGDFLNRCSIMSKVHPGEFVMEPLYFKETQLGFALFQAGVLEGTIYRSLARYISNALEGAVLISQLKQAQEAQEEAFTQVEKIVERRTAQLRREIRRKKELEEKLHQAQKMEAIGRLAGGIAHDFNNLLTAVNGSAELLMEEDLSQDSRLYTDIIFEAGTKGADLVQQLLMFSRKQIIRPKVLEINSVINNFEKILRRVIGEDIDLILKKNKRNLNILIDQSQLEQIIMNLSINARDAMPYGGRLQISTEGKKIKSEDEAPHGDLPQGDYALLHLKDSGEGIPEENLSQIFEPFFTTKDQGKGTGMGLATVYGIVKQNRGEILVTSKVGEYTEFSIYLPLTDKEKVQETDRIKTEHNLRGTETILIVEDEEVIRAMVTRTLQKKGYQVISAFDGVDALKKLENLTGEIDLLLTDLVMPRMGGRELEVEVSGIYPRIKVLFSSGYTQDALGRKGEDLNKPFIAKPFSPQELLKTIRNILDEE